jgi:hypothetical protein
MATELAESPALRGKRLLTVEYSATSWRNRTEAAEPAESQEHLGMVPPMELTLSVHRRGTALTRPAASRGFLAGVKWEKQMDATMQTAWRESP